MKHNVFVPGAAFAVAALTLVALTTSYGVSAGAVGLQAATQTTTQAAPTTQCG